MKQISKIALGLIVTGSTLLSCTCPVNKKLKINKATKGRLQEKKYAILLKAYTSNKKKYTRPLSKIAPYITLLDESKKYNSPNVSQNDGWVINLLASPPFCDIAHVGPNLTVE